MLRRGRLRSGPEGLKGFGVVVGTRSKAYFCEHARQRVTIGRTDLLTLDEAREKALAYLRQMREAPGVDPRAEERKVREAAFSRRTLTLTVALEEMLSDKEGHVRAGTADGYRAFITVYLAPWLDAPLATITRDAVIERYKQIAEGRGLGMRRDGGRFAGGRAEIKGGVATARAVMVALRAVWRFAKFKHSEQELPDPPTDVLRFVSKGWSKTEARDRVVPFEKLPAFCAAAIVYPNRVQGDLILFLLATGLRLGEAQKLCWEEVDVDGGMIRLAPARMKAGKKLEVPLTATAVEVLRRRAAVGRDSSGFVFPGRRRGVRMPRMGYATLSGALLEALSAAVGTKISAHDLRRTFATIALGAEVPLHVVETLTAHAPSGVTLRSYYAPSEADLRRAVAKIDARLRALCAPGSTISGAVS